MKIRARPCQKSQSRALTTYNEGIENVSRCVPKAGILKIKSRKMLIGFQSSGKDQLAVVLDSVFCTLIS